MGGYDKENGAELYFMDYLASSVKVPFAAHGFGGYLSLSIMDRYHKKGKELFIEINWANHITSAYYFNSPLLHIDFSLVTYF